MPLPWYMARLLRMPGTACTTTEAVFARLICLCDRAEVLLVPFLCDVSSVNVLSCTWPLLQVPVGGSSYCNK